MEEIGNPAGNKAKEDLLLLLHRYFERVPLKNLVSISVLYRDV